MENTKPETTIVAAVTGGLAPRAGGGDNPYHMKGAIEMSHECREPKSTDFRDGREAEGCWTEKDGSHVEQVAGNSGVYLIVTDKAGNVIRDDRPWQMREGA